MTPELKAAAERVRSVLAGEDGVKVYGCADWLTFFRAEKGMCLRAYLDEHPAGEDEPATVEYAKAALGGGYVFVHELDGRVTVELDVRIGLATNRQVDQLRAILERCV